MLGSESDADDAVQTSWLRLSQSGNEVENLRAWLTTVVARICLDRLRARRSRPEESVDDEVDDDAVGPEDEALLADSLGPALFVLMETLSPPERVAFVLHDLFDVPFDEVAPVVGRSSEAARQLASRARRRLRGRQGDTESNRGQRQIVQAFLAASREGDFEALLALLDPEVVLRADEFAITIGAPGEVRGQRAVAAFFRGRAEAAQLAILDGASGAVWAPGGRPRVVFAFTFRDGRIAAIDLFADRKRIHSSTIAIE